MGNVTLPTPLAVAGGALCLLAGYVVGVALGDGATDRSTAEVDSYDVSDNELCLTGEAVEQMEEAEDGMLCGEWRRGTASSVPRPGDAFTFVTITNERDGEQAVFIYGDVAR
ncbi:hypothetical protein [Nocardioides caldifontis]|uniref:hypothetical protein n=1 Tax=Nocardioides caldifontis TaxID=2588938 RepID=UPI0011DFD909|nr:hypothetical protein [Nocardioides caldifontis]